LLRAAGAFLVVGAFCLISSLVVDRDGPNALAAAGQIHDDPAQISIYVLNGAAGQLCLLDSPVGRRPRPIVESAKSLNLNRISAKPLHSLYNFVRLRAVLREDYGFHSNDYGVEPLSSWSKCAR
jgi:hypothetical protein